MVDKVGMLSTLRDGQVYMDAWPMRKELSPIFPEHRIIKATRFGVRIMPAVAAISVLTQLTFQNAQGLPQAIVVALFALSLPIQGYWWLGTRANTQLPPAMVSWYRELHQKILETGTALEPPKAKPRYKELAKLLKQAFRQLDEAVLERWF